MLNTMRPVAVNFEAFQGTASPMLYARIGANILFAGAAIVSFFTSTLDDPFAHFDSQPKWMFMTFCSFAVVSSSLAAWSATVSRLAE